MSAPRNPSFGPIEESSIPPLDSHLKTLANNKTRIGKVYDHLIGEFLRDHDQPGMIVNAEEIVRDAPMHIIAFLALTEGMPDLPNRVKLIELIEATMPKDGGGK
jgi:hypothetical protein